MINLDLSFVIQLINFLLLIVILNLFLYKPVRKVLAERQSKLQGAKERALQVDAEVTLRMSEYEQKLKEMKSATGAERGELKKEALKFESDLLEKARKEASESLASIKAKIADEAAKARENLKAQAEQLSGEICEKVLGRSL